MYKLKSEKLLQSLFFPVESQYEVFIAIAKSVDLIKGSVDWYNIIWGFVSQLNNIKYSNAVYKLSKALKQYLN